MGPPKSQICPYFKAGLCQKGRKCKFSHERDAGAVKANVYQDIREDDADNMENWDQKKLEEAVNFNEGKYVNPNKTNLPCNNFLNAIAEKKYGWFWVCPNGVNCKYKHALPQGFVLDTKKQVEKREFCIETDIDDARQALTAKGTPMTYDLYVEWRAKRKIRKEKEAEERRKEELKKVGMKVQKGKKIMSGKALFVFNPTLFKDDDDAADNTDLRENVEEDATLNVGGKKWEAKIVEEKTEEPEEEDAEKMIEEKPEKTEDPEPEAEEDVEVDEDVFAEEDLPDDI